jgi:alkaline phosphatase D
MKTRFFLGCLCVAANLFLSNFALAQTQKTLLVAGPMLGFVEHRSARIWLEVAPEATAVAIEYWQKNKPAEKLRAVYKGELQQTYNPVSFTLDNLAMNTNYEYAIYVNDILQKSLVANPHFTTKELWEYRKPAPDFNFVFGSCLYLNDSIYDRPGKPYGKGTKILKPMADETTAAFNVWMGDNLYFREADYSSLSGMKYRYSHDRATPDLQPVLGARPNYAIWDDHDFGPNDSDESFTFREECRELFKNYWGNPTYGQNNQGIYTNFGYSDCDFFLLDDRAFRSSDNMPDKIDGKPNPNKHYWGREQLTWLENALLTSKASFKFVVNGGQFGNPFDKKESAYYFPIEYLEFMDFLTTNKINGVVLLSGDRHFSEILQYPQGEKGYTIYEITNSSLGSSTYSTMKEPELSNPNRVAGSMINLENNYGVISISGERGKRTLHYDVKNNTGKVLFQYDITEQSLKWKRDKTVGED